MKKNLLVLTLLLTASLVYSQESVLLKYNFKKGKTYVQNTTMSNTVTQSMMGQEMKVVSDITSNSEYKIEGVSNEGNTTATVSITDASVHSVMMGKDTTIKMPTEGSLQRVVFSSVGKELSVESLDTSKNSPISGIKQFSKLFVLPGKPIKVGEKWQDKIVDSTAASQQNPFTMNTTSDTEYIFAGKESKDGKEYSKITFTSSMLINGKGSQMGMEMFIEGTGKVQGFFYFDSKESMVVYNESNTEMDMTIAVSGQQNMTIPMTQSMKTINKFQEKN